jgi:CTP:molybdopterin cytidylyltransferase MocA
MGAGVAGVLLAAGEGSRLGRPKALVEIGGRRLADIGVALLRDGGADPVLVVTGAAPVAVSGTLAVHNPDWRAGMGSSLRAGLAALLTASFGADVPGADVPGADVPGAVSASAGLFAAASLSDLDAAVIALVDQPLVGPEAVRRLIGAYRVGAGVAVAAYDGKPRNPVLIARQHWADVLALAEGDTGARPFLRAHPELVTLVECADTGSPDDIDTPADLDRVRNMSGDRCPPAAGG